MTLGCVLTRTFGPRPFGAAIGFADSVLSSLRRAPVGWSTRSVACARRTWGTEYVHGEHPF